VRSGGRRRATGAVWLAVVALALNALVPIHLAFDLAEALAPFHHDAAFGHEDSVERRVLALLSGHLSEDHETHHRGHAHGAACPVCSALGAIAGFAAPAPFVLPTPALAARSQAVFPAPAVRFVGVAFAYRSRAPPVI
jgi:Protein of unknown function (DUF2946)